MSHPPPIMTAQQLADFGAWLVEIGRGHLPVMLDRRGIQYLQPNKHDVVGLGLPPIEEALGETAAYLRAVF